jgi:hypothetical protein
MRLITIQDMYKVALESGGQCLSDAYVNARTKLLWQCSNGHRWEAVPDKVMRGSWCPYCAGKFSISIENMRMLAKNRGGNCLSDTVHNNRSMLLWECAQGHQWQAVVSSVKQGTWCPRCSYELRGKSRRLTIGVMQRLAQERGGKCLSDSYLNAHTKLLWECKDGHKWEAKPTNIKSGKWCPKCCGHQKLSINDAIDIASIRNGRCLSETYVNSKTKLLWECSEGHQWKSLYR